MYCLALFCGLCVALFCVMRVLMDCPTHAQHGEDGADWDLLHPLSFYYYTVNYYVQQQNWMCTNTHHPGAFKMITCVVFTCLKTQTKRTLEHKESSKP